MIRILLVDDQALVRAGFRMILDAEPEMEVVGEASDGREAVDQVRSLRPDVVLMDIRMPELDGLEASRRILSTNGGEAPKILMLTTFDLDEYVYEALRAGASGFLLKDTPPEQLVSAIHVIAQGEALLSPSITRRVISEFGTKPDGGHNDGIDVAVPQGTSVKAAENGVVAYAGNELKGYGNLILIRHANNWVSAYAHNDEILVKRGDKVRRGQIIAKAGATGSVSQPQVHFELRKGSRPVDPTKFMSDQAASAD